MKYVLKERIGKPDLFCGREEEMKRLIDWAARIPKEISKSHALLGRRKSGKTAIMQRLFNILWNKNGLVVPFYFEVLDQDMWLLEFAESYFCTFLSQFFFFCFKRATAYK
ncbi:MAG: hypothetical protein OMM_09363 [Candidatus Magnetoglobus multicellularis str. Araruama]|uniref:ATPase domain-containing protein n=1 Tax=Candidatus Magnetoglobus multicellularis str. Araruama TaxID=890399 RepID=A0A1V1P486_9BACT|nr:MAG: hypothetical protein OMM_09363 [Candidatus Magnetoglobus multicellularis str. Araruama]